MGYIKQTFKDNETVLTSEMLGHIEDGIVECCVFAVCQGVACDVDLYATFAVLQLCEGCLAHDSLRHDATCNADIATVFACGGFTYVVAFVVFTYYGQVDEAFLYFCTECVGWIFCCGVWVDAQVAQLLKVIAADDFLLAQFEYIHFYYIKLYERKGTTYISKFKIYKFKMSRKPQCRAVSFCLWYGCYSLEMQTFAW